MAEVLAKQPRPKGPNLTIVTNAGGPAVLATDALVAGGGRLTELSAERDGGATTRSCRRSGATTTRSTSSATRRPTRYAKALEIAAADPAADGMLVDPDAAGDDRSDEHGPSSCRRTRTIAGKPVLASWMGGRDVAEGAAHPATGRHPDVRLSRHGRARCSTTCGARARTCALLYETPALADDGDDAASTAPRRGASSRALAAEGRTLLTEVESKAVLAAYGIPITETRVAATDEARRRGRASHRLPGRAQAVQPHDHPQDRRRRRRAEPGRRRRGARGVRAHRGVGHRARAAPSTSRA